MRTTSDFRWGWAPDYVLAQRGESFPGDYVPMDATGARAVIERLAELDPAGLRAAWATMEGGESDRALRYSTAELCTWLGEELERPTGRVVLYVRSGPSSLGTLESSIDEPVVNLLDLVEAAPD